MKKRLSLFLVITIIIMCHSSVSLLAESQMKYIYNPSYHGALLFNREQCIIGILMNGLQIDSEMLNTGLSDIEDKVCFKLPGNAAYAWIEKKNLYKNTNDFKKVIELPIFQNDFSYSQSETRSAELMVQSKSEEERAAIWIYTFCKTVEDGNYPYPNNLLIEYVGAKARMFLQESFKEWLFKYNHKLPFSYIDSRMLKHVVFDNYKAVVDYAILNALMIRNEYVIALFDSEPNNDDKPFTYKNLRKNQLT